MLRHPLCCACIPCVRVGMKNFTLCINHGDPLDPLGFGQGSCTGQFPSWCEGPGVPGSEVDEAQVRAVLELVVQDLEAKLPRSSVRILLTTEDLFGCADEKSHRFH